MPRVRPSEVKCMACSGPMWPIKVFDKSVYRGFFRHIIETHTPMEYARAEAHRDGDGTYRVEGVIEADMCDDCGLVLFYGFPYDRPPE